MNTCPVEMRGVTPIPETGSLGMRVCLTKRKNPSHGNGVKLTRSVREGAVEVRPFTAETRLRVSMAQGLSGEAMKGNPTTTTVIPGVDESKITPEELSEPQDRLFVGSNVGSGVRWQISSDRVQE
jgi:hypothetical protein